MSQQIPSAPRVDTPCIPTLYQRKALQLLSEAWDAARAERCDVWQFAVEISQLRGAGLSNTDLRRLLCRGYLEHAWERTSARTSQRIFQRLNTLVLPKGTCFVLTLEGLELASTTAAEKTFSDVAPAEKQAEASRALPEVPRWDRESRQLWWRDYLIKQFRVPAANQETILAALQEEGWPARVDDPLSGTADIDSKVRLHDTIKALNRRHLHRILGFRGDGNGLGIRWVFLKQG